jgi:imidazolonepropionase
MPAKRTSMPPDDEGLLLLTGAAQVATCTGPASSDAGDPADVRRGVAVLVGGGSVLEVAPQADLLRRFPEVERFDCAGGVLTPGLVDSHTHAVFGRFRADEYPLRARGAPYMEIARRGGGIHASVRDLRARTEDELVELALPRLATMLSMGSTTVEVKSGYGLSTEDELKSLRAIRRLGTLQPVRIVATFLGAHEIPLEYRDRRERYVDLLVDEMIPAVSEAGLATFCDVFMEPGVYTGEETERILLAGLQHGLRPKLHADELEGSGGAELAARLGAASADHLGAVSQSGIEALAASGTVATLLPATLFFLGKRSYAPARGLLDAGATVAIATDFNPGSSPTPSLPFAMTAACSQMGMTPSEALRAATAGGAEALEIRDGRGTIAPDAPADLVLWRVESVDEIPYRLATPLVAAVWREGRRVG